MFEPLLAIIGIQPTRPKGGALGFVRSKVQGAPPVGPVQLSKWYACMPFIPLVASSIDTSIVPKKPLMNVFQALSTVATDLVVLACSSDMDLSSLLSASMRSWRTRIFASCDWSADCAKLAAE